MWSNIKSVFEEHISSENVPPFCKVNDNDEIAMYHQQTNYSQQTIEQTKFIHKVLSPDVSKPNHTVLNKMPGPNAVFSRKKTSRKKNELNHINH